MRGLAGSSNRAANASSSGSPGGRRSALSGSIADKSKPVLASDGLEGLDCGDKITNAQLLELPVDGVKIDRRFIAGIDLDPAATNLTTAIVGLSESLQLGCVAEGVEQPYQRDRLVSLGCNAFQGWLYSPAVPARSVRP